MPNLISPATIDAIYDFRNTPAGAGMGGVDSLVSLALSMAGVTDITQLTQEQGEQLLAACQRAFTPDTDRVINRVVGKYTSEHISPGDQEDK